jgi:uncharacterized protein (DUF486 family)
VGDQKRVLGDSKSMSILKIFKNAELISKAMIPRVRRMGYCLMVPANRAGYLSGDFTGYQLKILQECITLGVFVVFAWIVLKEKLTWNYAVSFALLVAALYFATAFKPGSPPAGH